MSRAQKHIKGGVDSDSPEGWTTAKLGDLCTHPQYGWTTSANKNATGLKLIRTTDISGGTVNWSTVPVCAQDPDDPKKYLLAPGDILVSRAGSVGLSYLVKECPEAIFASYLIRFRPKPPLENEFVALFLKSPQYWAAIAEEAAGIAIPNVNASKLKELGVPLAPLPEQKRIVAKVEELLTRVNATKERLAKVAMILKRFRQAVLAAACSGRLTANWREANPSSTSYVEEELPLCWQTASVGEVIESLKYGTSQKCSYEKLGVPVLRIPNIEQGVVTHSDLKYAELQEREFQQLRLRSGDILMIRSNGSVSLVGKSALVREIDEGFAYAGYLIRLRPDFSKIIPDFLNLVIGSHDVRIQIEVPARSTSGVHNINSKEVRALQFFLPPLDEQQEIMRRVEAMFKLADVVEKRVAAAKVRSDKLTQAILAKAFRGELVPTEAELAHRERRSYETASELLARINSAMEKKYYKKVINLRG